MRPSLVAFADELEKVANKDLLKEFGTSASIAGLAHALQGDIGAQALKSALGFGAGDVAGGALARALKVKGLPGLGLRIAGGMLGSSKARHMGEKTAAKLPPQTTLTPQSSNVKGWRYDPATQSMFVTFKGGATYRYDGVPPAVAQSFRRSKSVGKAVGRRLKEPGYEYEKVGGDYGRLLRELGGGMRRIDGKLFWVDPVRGTVEPYKGGVHLGKTAAKLAKSYTCKFCKEPATKGVIWAEGRAIVPCCDKHLEKGKGSVGMGGVDTVRDLTKTSSVVLERVREGGRPSAQERFVASRSGSKNSRAAAYYAKKRRELRKQAGVAKKQVTWQGLTMKLEYEKGDERSGVNGATGKAWSRTMKDHYGYMPGTYGKGADGDAIDIYLNPGAGDEAAKVVYKIRQKKKTGEFDEDKFMVGYPSAADAKKAFLRNMPEWAFGSMMSMGMDSFKKMVGQA